MDCRVCTRGNPLSGGFSSVVNMLNFTSSPTHFMKSPTTKGFLSLLPSGKIAVCPRRPSVHYRDRRCSLCQGYRPGEDPACSRSHPRSTARTCALMSHLLAGKAGKECTARFRQCWNRYGRLFRHTLNKAHDSVTGCSLGYFVFGGPFVNSSCFDKRTHKLRSEE